MKDVLARLRSCGKRLSKNRLFTDWFADDSIPPREKFLFAPMSLDFVMGFRDFNKYYVHYEHPQNELEEALNGHAAEDSTHSILLLHDWCTLGFDERLGWKPRDVLWWMTSERTETSRRADFELMKMIHDNPDPLVRFAIIEAMETAGNVFFSRTVKIIDQICEGREHTDFPYFGKYHFDRENGHLQNANEGLFFNAELSEAQRERALGLVDRVFEIFEGHFDTWCDYARGVKAGTYDFQPAREGRADTALRADRPADVTQYLALDYPKTPAPALVELAAERHRAVDELWKSQGYTWIRTAHPGDFRRMTRLFLLQWVVDNWACADWFTFDTPYAQPTQPVERGINRLSKLYASEMRRRYVEWETLRLDEFTGWSASEALRHYWLDERVELHRKVFADLRKLTMKYPKPLHRYWIMKCFVRFGDTMMHSLGAAMAASAEPNENFITFAGQPERLHPDLPRDAEADAAIALLELTEPSAEDLQILRTLTQETLAQEAERAAITWRIVEEGRYLPLDEAWLARGEKGAVAPRAKVVGVDEGAPR